jgi:hypothetical protein
MAAALARWLADGWLADGPRGACAASSAGGSSGA